MSHAKHLLVLGGTARARRLAERLARTHTVTYSLAGVTPNAQLPRACHHRQGGFGGVDGLVTYLRQQQISQVIDATHPHAVQISTHAARACQQTGLKLSTCRHHLWQPQAQDRWRSFSQLAALQQALRQAPAQRILLATGAQLGSQLEVGPHQFWLRCIRKPCALSPAVTPILARGPFSLAQELSLLRTQAITLLVCKNRGGRIGQEKLLAARQLRIPVWLLCPAA